MPINELLEWAKLEALALVNRLEHTDDEKRLIALGYMCGFCDGNLTNGQGSNPAKSGANGRT